MYGYRLIAGCCVNCMTFDEAMELANTYANVSGQRYKVEGELIQHYNGQYVANEHIYCWDVRSLGEYIGNQRIKGTARSNGRAVQEFS